MKHTKMRRRTFLGAALAGVGTAAMGAGAEKGRKRPNIVFVFADQWRAQATGYNGDPNAHTPNLDRLAGESVNFTQAVSGCPVCSPYRASLITGQYWLTHGVLINDVPLSNEAVTVAKTLRDAGYATGYIGKWHLDGRDRLGFTPPESRQGFQFWKALECTHDYNASRYYDDDPAPKQWEGYDALAQTREAVRYIQQQRTNPFALFMSWGPPHDPYRTAPPEYFNRRKPEDIVLRANVPAEKAADAQRDQHGYYAHIMALDECLGQVMAAIEQSGAADDTLFVFTSDHGDMLYSHGMMKKQKPYDEAIRVPFLLRYPHALGREGRNVDWLLNAPDIMPTLLGLCGVAVPASVEGCDFSSHLLRGGTPPVDATLLMCAVPFGEWTRANGGREYRGIRTRRHTYVRALDGPWLLFDNDADPYQQDNLCGKESARDIQAQLDRRLVDMLRERKDAFEPGDVYLDRFNYRLNAAATMTIMPK